jgi:hypothetical protein
MAIKIRSVVLKTVRIYCACLQAAAAVAAVLHLPPHSQGRPVLKSALLASAAGLVIDAYGAQGGDGNGAGVGVAGAELLEQVVQRGKSIKPRGRGAKMLCFFLCFLLPLLVRLSSA